MCLYFLKNAKQVQKAIQTKHDMKSYEAEKSR